MTTSVSIVANPKPLATTKEMGAQISDVLVPLVSNSPVKIFAPQPRMRGISPTTVVRVVRKTGRRR